MPKPIFNHAKLAQQRDRAAQQTNLLAKHDFLYKYAAQDLFERLNASKRNFTCALELGARKGYLNEPLHAQGKIKYLLETEISPSMSKLSRNSPKLLCDLEQFPYRPASFDLILSMLNLHWFNDPAQSLQKIQHCLQPNGVFLANLFGGQTLLELKQALLQAQQKTEHPISVHTIPAIALPDLNQLLKMAGFEMVVTDQHQITLEFNSVLELLYEIKYIGEANILYATNLGSFTQDLLTHITNYYPNKTFNKIRATFEIISLLAVK